MATAPHADARKKFVARFKGPGGPKLGQKQNQADVHYRDCQNPQECCDSCTHFQAPKSCELVDGDISPMGVCDLYDAKDQGMQGMGMKPGQPPEENHGQTPEQWKAWRSSIQGSF